MQNKKLQLKCSKCKKDFSRYIQKNRPQLFCSRNCYLHSTQNSNTHKQLMTGMKAEKNYGWKGTKVSYKGLHRWIQLNYGYAKNHKCAKCKGKSGSKTMNWANLDHKYTRDIKMWLPLCKICHSRYDQKKFKTYSKLLLKVKLKKQL